MADVGIVGFAHIILCQLFCLNCLSAHLELAEKQFILGWTIALNETKCEKLSESDPMVKCQPH